MTDLLLTVPQSAALSGVTEDGLRKAIYAGRLKATRVGQRAWIIRKRDLDQWIMHRLKPRGK